MVVSVYMYMRLRGYPAAQISILSPYNGQVALLRDVIERRCAQHPAFGRPHKARIPSRLLLLLVTAMGFLPWPCRFLLSTDQVLLQQQCGRYEFDGPERNSATERISVYRVRNQSIINEAPHAEQERRDGCACRWPLSISTRGSRMSMCCCR